MKKLKNVQLIHITIAAFCIIVIIAFLYQNNFCKIYSISIDVSKIEKELDSKEVKIEKASKNIQKIICPFPLDEIEDKEYRNYVLGKNNGKKINFLIILKSCNNYYKAKTLLLFCDDKNAYISSCVRNMESFDGIEIFLLNKDNKKIYKYIGEIGE